MQKMWVALGLMMVLPATSVAREHRVAQLPHGARFGCDVCHTPTRGLTDFGFDSFEFTEGGNVVWSRLAARDSDRDGYTNGVELGDPDGTWRTGLANPSGPFTNPTDPNSNFCGDGIFQPNEECEGTNLLGETCAGLGLIKGQLSCSDRCVYDVSLCGDCGDGVKQSNEDCDGTDFGVGSCEMMGFEGGTLGCDASCKIVTTACLGDNHGSVPATCGDRIRQPEENCDGSDVGGASCISLGYSGGLVMCTPQCTFDASRCFQGEPSDDPFMPGEPMTMGDGLATANGYSTVIEMEGRACSAAGGTPLWMALLLLGFIRRRQVA